MMTQRTDVKLIKHVNDCTEWFANTDIKGGVSYFLKDSYHNGVCLFNEFEYDLSKYETIIKPKYHKLVDLVKEMPSIASTCMGRCFGVETNDRRLKDFGSIECFVALNKSPTRIKYLDKYEFTEDNSFWKVITARAAHKGGSGFGFITIGSPKQIHNGSYVSFRVNSEAEALSLKSYLQTPFANLMLSIRKISQDINTSVVKWIPIVPFDRTWTDDKVFSHFKFTKEVINMIKNLYK